MKQFLFLATILGTLIEGDSMKLVDTKTGHVVIEFIDHNPKFHSRFLEKVLTAEGILIPPPLRKEFEDKEVIFVDDPLFEKAFKEVYLPFCLSTRGSTYEWQN